MKKVPILIVNSVLVAILAACGASPSAPNSAISQPSATSAPAPTAIPTTVPDVLAEKSETHYNEAEEPTAEVDPITTILLEGDSISVEGEGVKVDGTTATITAAGHYQLSGDLDNGQILVDTNDKALVQLELNGVAITNPNGAPIAVLDAEEVLITLAEGSQNTLTDGETYTFLLPEDEEPNAALFSKADLTIAGNGELTVQANFNDAIASKDGLVIASGTINVQAADDGIRGKDYLIIKSGTFNITAGGDGLKSDEADDPSRGYILIEDGTLNIIAGGDGIQAETDVAIANGTLTITTANGHTSPVADTVSAKALKAKSAITIDGGAFTIDAADDALHSNNSLTINNGTFEIATGDDGIHADASVTINGGTIAINASYEGIESASLTINDGDIRVVSADDALNAAGAGALNGNPGGAPGRGPRNDGSWLAINGGRILLDSSGDGLDSNGNVSMTNGTLIIHGTTQRMNSAVDYDGSFAISGGLLVAVGSSGMSQTADESSTQNALLVNFDTPKEAGTLINLQNEAGESILTFEPRKSFQSLSFSSPSMTNGNYTLYLGGSASGTNQDGLFIDGSYTPGTKYADLTVSSVVTRHGNMSRFGR
jgi:hypothetical protein